MALHSIQIEGFKSIKKQALELNPLNVFIGGNGAGKSNLVNVFTFLNRVTRQELAVYTAQAGGAIRFYTSEESIPANCQFSWTSGTTQITPIFTKSRSYLQNQTIS